MPDLPSWITPYLPAGDFSNAPGWAQFVSDASAFPTMGSATNFLNQAQATSNQFGQQNEAARLLATLQGAPGYVVPNPGGMYGGSGQQSAPYGPVPNWQWLAQNIPGATSGGGINWGVIQQYAQDPTFSQWYDPNYTGQKTPATQWTNPIQPLDPDLEKYLKISGNLSRDQANLAAYQNSAPGTVGIGILNALQAQIAGSQQALSQLPTFTQAQIDQGKALQAKLAGITTPSPTAGIQWGTPYNVTMGGAPQAAINPSSYTPPAGNPFGNPPPAPDLANRGTLATGRGEHTTTGFNSPIAPTMPSFSTASSYNAGPGFNYNAPPPPQMPWMSKEWGLYK
ncbi:MAG TPA: hypothetical protein VF077_13000 [Nitrospiraceae bacterium]